MKIALIIKDYSLKKGGLERFVVNLSKELIKLGHKVHVLANHWDSSSEPAIIFHKIPVIKISFFLKNISFAINCQRFLKNGHYDIICGFSRTYPLDIYRIGHKIRHHLIKVHYRNKFVRFIKYISIRHQTILFLERQIFKTKNYKKIVANSNFSKKHVVLYHKIPEDRIEVIYNGVDLDRFNPNARNLFRKDIRTLFNFKDDDIILLFVGRNFKLKGVKNLIKSIALLKNKNVKGLIVGKGNQTPYKSMAKRLGIESRIFFTGGKKKIEKYYAAGDIFVFPTRYDPFANVCLEALACGLPVITTKENGASEIIENGKNGYVLKDYNSSKELASKIDLLINHQDKEKLKDFAYQTASQFTTAENAKKFEKLFKNTLLQKKL